jgi:hypothetical protein
MAGEAGAREVVGPMDTACNRIADRLASVIEGEAWYGDSLREILTANAASRQ